MEIIAEETTLKFLLELMNLERKYSDEDVGKRTARRAALGELMTNFIDREVENEN